MSGDEVLKHVGNIPCLHLLKNMSSPEDSNPADDGGNSCCETAKLSYGRRPGVPPTQYQHASQVLPTQRQSIGCDWASEARNATERSDTIVIEKVAQKYLSANEANDYRGAIKADDDNQAICQQLLQQLKDQWMPNDDESLASNMQSQVCLSLLISNLSTIESQCASPAELTLAIQSWEEAALHPSKCEEVALKTAIIHSTTDATIDAIFGQDASSSMRFDKRNKWLYAIGQAFMIGKNAMLHTVSFHASTDPLGGIISSDNDLMKILQSNSLDDNIEKLEDFDVNPYIATKQEVQQRKTFFLSHHEVAEETDEEPDGEFFTDVELIRDIKLQMEESTDTSCGANRSRSVGEHVKDVKVQAFLQDSLVHGSDGHAKSLPGFYTKSISTGVTDTSALKYIDNIGIYTNSEVIPDTQEENGEIGNHIGRTESHHSYIPHCNNSKSCEFDSKQDPTNVVPVHFLGHFDWMIGGWGGGSKNSVKEAANRDLQPPEQNAARDHEASRDGMKTQRNTRVTVNNEGSKSLMDDSVEADPILQEAKANEVLNDDDSRQEQGTVKTRLKNLEGQEQQEFTSQPVGSQDLFQALGAIGTLANNLCDSESQSGVKGDGLVLSHVALQNRRKGFKERKLNGTTSYETDKHGANDLVSSKKIRNLRTETTERVTCHTDAVVERNPAILKRTPERQTRDTKTRKAERNRKSRLRMASKYAEAGRPDLGVGTTYLNKLNIRSKKGEELLNNDNKGKEASPCQRELRRSSRLCSGERHNAGCKGEMQKTLENPSSPRSIEKRGIRLSRRKTCLTKPLIMENKAARDSLVKKPNKKTRDTSSDPSHEMAKNDQTIRNEDKERKENLKRSRRINTEDGLDGQDASKKERPCNDRLLGCPRCRYSIRGCSLCRNPNYTPRRRNSEKCNAEQVQRASHHYTSKQDITHQSARSGKVAKSKSNLRTAKTTAQNAIPSATDEKTTYLESAPKRRLSGDLLSAMDTTDVKNAKSPSKYVLDGTKPLMGLMFLVTKLEGPNAKSDLEEVIRQLGGIVKDDIPAPSDSTDTLNGCSSRRQSLQRNAKLVHSSASEIDAVISDSMVSTTKCLYAAIKGIPVISSAWVIACAQSEEKLSWDRYIVRRTLNTPGDFDESLMPNRLFSGMKVYYSEFSKNRQVMSTLLRHAGAVLVKDLEKDGEDCDLILIEGEKADESTKSKENTIKRTARCLRVQVRDRDWIIEAMLSGEWPNGDPNLRQGRSSDCKTARSHISNSTLPRKRRRASEPNVQVEDDAKKLRQTENRFNQEEDSTILEKSKKRVDSQEQCGACSFSCLEPANEDRQAGDNDANANEKRRMSSKATTQNFSKEKEKKLDADASLQNHIGAVRADGHCIESDHDSRSKKRTKNFEKPCIGRKSAESLKHAPESIDFAWDGPPCDPPIGLQSSPLRTYYDAVHLNGELLKVGCHVEMEPGPGENGVRVAEIMALWEEATAASAPRPFGRFRRYYKPSETVMGKGFAFFGLSNRTVLMSNHIEDRISLFAVLKSCEVRFPDKRGNDSSEGAGVAASLDCEPYLCGFFFDYELGTLRSL